MTYAEIARLRHDILQVLQARPAHVDTRLLHEALHILDRAAGIRGDRGRRQELIAEARRLYREAHSRTEGQP
jgi:hypothetical protein